MALIFSYLPSRLIYSRLICSSESPKGEESYLILFVPCLSDRNHQTAVFSYRYINKCIKNSNLMILIHLVHLPLILAIKKGKQIFISLLLFSLSDIQLSLVAGTSKNMNLMNLFNFIHFSLSLVIEEGELTFTGPLLL